MNARLNDCELWGAFTSSALPERQWTHREHLRGAWMFLQRHDLDDAHILMRVGVIRLNAFHAPTETPTRGYHETMTRVWLTLVRASMATRVETSEAFLEACGDHLAQSVIYRRYSRDRSLSARARAAFVEPDLLPFDAVHADGV